ncbi:MAG: hypothetical protein AAGF33_17690, partial [Pseudomonadota bacterium]
RSPKREPGAARKRDRSILQIVRAIAGHLEHLRLNSEVVLEKGATNSMLRDSLGPPGSGYSVRFEREPVYRALTLGC